MLLARTEGHADLPGLGGPEWVQRVAAAVRAEDYEQLMQLFWTRVFTEPGSGNLIEDFVQTSRETPQEVFRNAFTVDDPGTEVRSLLPMLQVPTLILHGEEDRLIPVEVGRYLTDHIPGAQFYVFKSRCHGLFFTATAEFAQVVRNFIHTG